MVVVLDLSELSAPSLLVFKLPELIEKVHTVGGELRLVAGPHSMARKILAFLGNRSGFSLFVDEQHALEGPNRS
ncbi:MAG TPA: hypothetical protein EYH34_07585 [Planctomycetes bacterium]|nr:hypothetical protein [Planctomycetota bacterium]